jgi:hypothetical protein
MEIGTCEHGNIFGSMGAMEIRKWKPGNILALENATPPPHV